MLSIDDRILTKVFIVETGYGAKKIKTKFPRKDSSIVSVNCLLHQIDSAGSANHAVKYLKEQLIVEWQHFDQHVIVSQWNIIRLLGIHMDAYL